MKTLRALITIVLAVSINCAASAQIVQQLVVNSAYSAPPATWTLVQHPNNFGCTVAGTGSTQTIACTVTATATTAGNALILLSSIFGGSNTAPTFLSASGDSTWTHCPSSYATQAALETVDCAYILSAAGGATSITFNWTGNTSNTSHFYADVELLEVHRSAGTASYDAGAATTVSGTASRVGPACSIAGTSDYVAQWIAESATIVSISGAAYTNPFDLDNTSVDAAFAGALNQSSAPAQTWTTSGDTSADGASMACVALR
jgi:hypothetical protein